MKNQNKRLQTSLKSSTCKLCGWSGANEHSRFYFKWLTKKNFHFFTLSDELLFLSSEKKLLLKTLCRIVPMIPQQLAAGPA
jgi:hypothetical protein